MSDPVQNTEGRATRRYRRDMLIAAGLYTAFVFAGSYAIRYMAPPQWLILLLALAPLLPALLMLRAFVVYLNAVDEFQRRLQTEAIMIAAAVVGFGSFAYGFLEEWAGFPHLPLIFILPALIGSWGVARFFVRMRYK